MLKSISLQQRLKIKKKCDNERLAQGFDKLQIKPNIESIRNKKRNELAYHVNSSLITSNITKDVRNFRVVEFALTSRSASNKGKDHREITFTVNS